MRICRIAADAEDELGFCFDHGVVPWRNVFARDDTPRGLAASLRSASVLDCLPPDGQAFARARELADWLDARPEIATALTLPLSAVRLRRPIERPPKLFLLAGNYAAHVEEGGDLAVERRETFPYVFMKPSTALADPGAEFRLPDCSPRHLDWELELGVIIGRRIRGVSESEALAAIAGYTVVNDLSDRRFHPNSDRVERPRDGFFDWLHGKWHDGSCPMGPCVLSADAVEDPQQFPLRLTVNGDVKQDASTAQQVFPVAAVVAFVASFVTLEPGDVISTGTPAGVGNTSGTFLRAGDRIAATIEGIGTLETRVVDA